ncbi:MAG TPA: Flp pilus assembly protein CpaB [Gaiellaceae bacterium]
MQELFGRMFKNRGSALIAGVLVALLAIIILVVYLQSYRSSVNSGKRPERVLVATKLIPRGTSGTTIASQGLYQATTVQKDQVKILAIADPAAIDGRIAAADIFPGQQLTQDDFTTESASSIPYQITGKQRAIAIPVDGAHGVAGQVAAGDFVDVYIGTVGGDGDAGETGPQALLTLLAPDVKVLVAPGTGSTSAVLRVTDAQAPEFAFAADNTTIWLVLRPQVGASVTPQERVTLSTLLANAGIKDKT